MCFKIALGGERSVANLALERALSCMYPVVHLQGRLARQNSMAENTFVGVSQFGFYVIDKAF
jgi:hypothetical protein